MAAYRVTMEMCSDDCTRSIKRSFTFELLVDAVNYIAAMHKVSDPITLRIKSAVVVVDHKKAEDITEMFRVLVTEARK